MTLTQAILAWLISNEIVALWALQPKRRQIPIRSQNEGNVANIIFEKISGRAGLGGESPYTSAHAPIHWRNLLSLPPGSIHQVEPIDPTSIRPPGLLRVLGAALLVMFTGVGISIGGFILLFVQVR